MAKKSNKDTKDGKFIGAYFPPEEHAALVADAKAHGRSLRRHLRWLALKDTQSPEEGSSARAPQLAACRVCGCTDDDCRQCIEKTGEPCHWVAPDLCSACAPEAGCVINVDCRNGAYTYTATGKWYEEQKIQARASCTSGAEWAARACAAKLLGIPAKDVVLQEKPKLQWDRAGFRQFTATKPQPQEDDDDE